MMMLHDLFQIITIYSFRAKIETMFVVIKHLPEVSSYHFRTKIYPVLKRGQQLAGEVPVHCSIPGRCQRLYQYHSDLVRSGAAGRPPSTAKGLVPGQLVALYKAMGGGLEIQAGKSFVPADTMEIMRRRTNWGSLIPPRDLPDSLNPKAAPVPLSLPAGPDW